MKPLDLAGKRFGRWTVERRNGSIDGQSAWECTCDCGAQGLVRGCVLNKGKSLSCGCYAREVTLAASITHGMKGKKEYKAWDSIKQRCYNIRHKSYEDYGGRGITMCDEWLDSFEQFYADMGPAPSRYHSIDRKDNDLGYFKVNCRWATQTEQNRNRRSNQHLTLLGETKLACEWGEDPRCPVSRFTFEKRLSDGWTVERAFTQPHRCLRNAA